MTDQELERWENFRAFSLESTRKEQEAFLNDILTHIGYNHPIGYHFNLSKCELKIYAQYPGLIIGPYGRNVQYIEDKLDVLYPRTRRWHVLFEEVMGGFILAKED